MSVLERASARPAGADPVRAVGRTAHGSTTAIDEIMVFANIGLPMQDLVACERVYARALAAGAGGGSRSTTNLGYAARGARCAHVAGC